MFMQKTRTRFAVVAIASIAILATLVGPAFAESQFGGNQGCTPGYWKNHTSNWPGTNISDDDLGNPKVISPGAQLGELFGYTVMQNGGVGAYKTTTLLGALNLKGGPGIDGAAQIEFRAAAAAWLNAADDRVDYLYRRTTDTATLESIRTMVQNSLGNRDNMLAVATALDTANNGQGGCPLS
jgi:hypothetical protein